jgi:GNAT superfamily N-acetyltransferase
MFDEKTRDGLRLTGDPSKISLDQIAHWLSNEAYWALGRSRAAFDTAVAHSHLYGVVDDAGVTVACLRVVTDESTFAWLCDVFVDAAHRGRGIGTWMVGEVTRYWTAAGVPRIVLATKDAHDVYASVGYAPLASPERFMEIDRRATF